MLLATLLGCTEEGPAPPPPEEPWAPVQTRVHVDRSARTIEVVDAEGVLRTGPVGIGRGGLGEKRSMDDLITPTGVFTVDLVLHAAGTHNAVRWGAAVPTDPELSELLGSLEGLFANMNRIDFDGDGQADGAYGDAYIGLSSPDAVTGPKLRRHSASGLPYWYSIALHATPDPANLGQANSGGCVHVDASLLDHLIRDGTLGLGAEVTILDGP